MNSNPEVIESDRDFNQTQKPIQLSSTQEITWTARNLKSRPTDPSYSFDSPPFDYQNATWCLRLYPNHYQGSYYYIGVTIVRLRSSVPRHRLLYNLTHHTDNVNGTSLKVADFDETHKEKGDMRFINSYEVFGKNSYRQTDIVRVTCEVFCYESRDVNAVSLDVNAVSRSNLLMQEDTDDFGPLCQNFRNLFLSGQNHDVTLKVKDKVFHAHRDILRVRSPVLESMLSDDMFEKNSGSIDIPDCDPDAFEQFLFYLYSGRVETLDTGNMLPLYCIADKYDMEHLKVVCRDFIKNMLTCTNVSDVIQLALNHSDAVLQECATEFFLKEIRSVLRTGEWKRFLTNNPTQANELIVKGFDSLHTENN